MDITEIQPLITKSQLPDTENSETYVERAANDTYETVNEESQNIEDDVIWLREQRILNKTIHWHKRPSIIMICLVSFFSSLTMFCGESSRQIITYKLARYYLIKSKEKEYISPRDVQVLLSNLELAYTILKSIVALIASGKVGPLSDKYGRKLILILIIGFITIGRTFLFIVMNDFSYLKFNLMVLGQFIINFFGGIITILTMCNCYVTDVAEPDERMFSIGFCNAAFFAGMSIGPIIGNLILHYSDNGKDKLNKFNGILLSEFDPLKFELIVLYLLLLFTIFVLPESRSKKARLKSKSSANLLNTIYNDDTNDTDNKLIILKNKFLEFINFLRPLKLFFLLPKKDMFSSNYEKLKQNRIIIIILVLCSGIMILLETVTIELVMLYGILKFSWEERDINYLLTVTCLFRSISLIFFAPIISHKISQKFLKYKTIKNQIDMVDLSICIIGLIADIVGQFMLRFSPNTTYILISVLFMGFSSLANPCLSSSIVKYFSDSKIGEVFSGLALVQNLFTIFGPIVLISLYKLFIVKFNDPGLIFIIISSILTICLVLILYIKSSIELNKFTDYNDSDNQIILLVNNETDEPVKIKRIKRRKNKKSVEVIDIKNGNIESGNIESMNNKDGDFKGGNNENNESVENIDNKNQTDENTFDTDGTNKRISKFFTSSNESVAI